MAYKDVLVHIGAVETPALAAAITLARHHDAHLIGLGVQAPPYVGLYSTEPVPPSVIDALEAASAGNLAKARARFEHTVEHYGYTGASEWRSERGRLLDSIPDGTAATPISSTSSTGPTLATRISPFGLPADLVIAGGPPGVHCPIWRTRATMGERGVVVAWNASREAARAIADAMPVLIKAQKVDVLVVSPRLTDYIPGLDIARHLAAHGVTANVVDRVKDLDPATEILEFPRGE